jgi:hypothetical protein
MVVALRAALKIVVESLFPNDLGAAFALQPQAFRANAALFIFSGVFNSRLLPREPRHGEHSHQRSM